MQLDDFLKRFSGLTEEYRFYDGKVTLRYEVEKHRYLLLNSDGTLEEVPSVTQICHILDKSAALVPWSARQMQIKLLKTCAPFKSQLPEGPGYIFPEKDFTQWIEEGKSAHKEQLEEAGDIGHTAHAWIEQLIKAILAGNESRKLELLAKLPENEKAANCCGAALSWMERHSVRWISTERKIYSRCFKYAGTLDGMCRASSCDDPKCCPEPFKDRLTLVDWKTSNYLYLEFKMQVSAYQRAWEEENGEIIEDIWILRLGKDTAEFDPWHITSDEFFENWEGFEAALSLYHAVNTIKNRMTQVQGTKRLQAKAERDRELAVKCSKSDRYKGCRPTTCNGTDHPCETCRKKYEDRHKSS